jgi:hypothetical protein
MKYLTKQPSCMSSINFIFKVHNLLPKLYKQMTSEIVFHIMSTNFQAPVIKQKSH